MQKLNGNNTHSPFLKYFKALSHLSLEPTKAAGRGLVYPFPRGKDSDPQRKVFAQGGTPQVLFLPTGSSESWHVQVPLEGWGLQGKYNRLHPEWDHSWMLSRDAVSGARRSH